MNSLCERCGHLLSDHDNEGNCCRQAHFGNSQRCPCAGYLGALGSLPELVGQALYSAPGRDRDGLFYSSSQARRVAMLVDAMLDTTMPTKSVDAVELLETWADRNPIGELRAYTLARDTTGFFVQLVANWDTLAGHRASETWTHRSDTARDCAAKAIMRASQEGHP